MRRRLMGVLATLAILLPAVGIGGAHPALAYALNACTSISQPGDYHKVIERDIQQTNTKASNYDPYRGYGYYDAVYGEFVAAPQGPCVNVLGGSGVSEVMPANIEELNSSGGTIGMVQLGMWQATGQSSAHWAVTANDGCSPCGGMSEISGPSIPDPVWYDRYRLTIYWDSGTNQWVYVVNDLSNSSRNWYITEPSHWHTGSRVWWGYESDQKPDLTGDLTSNTNYKIYMHNMQRGYTDGNYAQADGLTSASIETVGTTDTAPSCYIGGWSVSGDSIVCDNP